MLSWTPVQDMIFPSSQQLVAFKCHRERIISLDHTNRHSRYIAVELDSRSMSPQSRARSTLSPRINDWCFYHNLYRQETKNYCKQCNFSRKTGGLHTSHRTPIASFVCQRCSHWETFSGGFRCRNFRNIAYTHHVSNIVLTAANNTKIPTYGPKTTGFQ